tara:strand:+ start:20413 stop:20634 length:222 start_codon:yes stop_codon:yes gene_type:complete
MARNEIERQNRGFMVLLGIQALAIGHAPDDHVQVASTTPLLDAQKAQQKQYRNQPKKEYNNSFKQKGHKHKHR